MLSVWLLASLGWATSAQAFVITRVSSPTFYYDTGYNCAYAGYVLENNDSQAYPDLWASAQGFSGTEISLADNEDGQVHVGRLAVGEKRAVFFYLKKAGTQAGSSTHDIRVATLAGTMVAQQSFTLTFGNQVTAGASTNTISVVNISSGTSSIGSTLQISVTGNSGPVMSGIPNVSLTPAAAPSWRPDAFELERVAVTFPSSAEPAKNDVLAFDLSTAAPVDYVATYTFRSVGTTPGATPLTPLAYVGSAQAYVHTAVDAAYLGLSPVASPQNQLTVSRSPAAVALAAGGGTQTHSIVVRSANAAVARLDRLEDALSGSGATYVAGSSKLNGAASADPVSQGSALSWVELPDIAAAGTLTLTFDVRYAANSGTVTHSARAGVGPSWLDTTTATTDVMPAVATVYVGNAPDQDGDGLADLREAQLGTNPASKDTDGDGLEDGVEVNATGALSKYGPTDPLDSDSDDGGANDGREVLTDLTDPHAKNDDHVCNNGIRTSDEACDDGNAVDTDGCTRTCQIVDGYTCRQDTNLRSVCAPQCGDGKVVSGKEQCDDQSSPGADGDGCSAQCTVEHGYVCDGSPSVCRSTCGDGVVASDEECDDAATRSGDGCSASCKVEAGYACGREPSTCEKTCGDGALSALEECDDGGAVAGDGCSPRCSVEHGYKCSGSPSRCATSCGDGLIAATEGCDDHNVQAGDGCSAACKLEPGYSCEREPSLCKARCGDGQILGDEECDDANTTSGDGCSASCRIEDRDSDGVLDNLDNCPSIQNVEQSDLDGDGTGDACDADRDGDGLSDTDERDKYHTSLEARDSDADGLDDGEEVALVTDPNDADTDDDGVLDGEEPNHETDSDEDGLNNVLDPDSDNDGLFDGTELGVVVRDLSSATDRSRGHFVADADPTTTTDPLRADTDGGGECDGHASVARVCVSGEDQNADGSVDPGEHDPRNKADDIGGGVDSDGDGLPDAVEARLGTDPKKVDTDGDGLSDGDEVKRHTDPLRLDTDGDGVNDGREVSLGSDPLTAPPDEYSLAGGTAFGCSTTGRSSGSPFWLLPAALVFLGARSRRRRAAQLLLCLCIWHSDHVMAQQAQGLALNHFDAAERGTEWFASDTLDLRGHGRVAAGVVNEWAYRPLVVLKNGGQQQAVVRNQLVVHPGVSIVAWERWRFSLDLPLQLYADGRDASISGVTYTAPQHTASIGDARVGVVARLFGAYGEALSIAAGLQLLVPTGDQSTYAGDGATRIAPHLMASGETEGFAYAAKLGVGLRSAAHTFFASELGSYAYFAASLGIRLLDRRLLLGPELFGRSDLTHHQLFDRHTTPLELLVGAHYSFDNGLRLGAGIGFGLTAGLGAPEHRGLLCVEWQSPLPVAAPASAIDPAADSGARVGCPERLLVEPTASTTCVEPLDTDHDGVLDADDACPELPGERADDPQRSGCPKTLGADRDPT